MCAMGSEERKARIVELVLARLEAGEGAEPEREGPGWILSEDRERQAEAELFELIRAAAAQLAESELLQMMQGSPNDAVKLAFLPAEAGPEAVDGLNLWRLSEFERTRGGVAKVKLVEPFAVLRMFREANKP